MRSSWSAVVVGTWLIALITLVTVGAQQQPEGPVCVTFQTNVTIQFDVTERGDSLEWCAPTAPATLTAAQAMTWAHVVYVDASTMTPFPPTALTAVECSGVQPVIACRALIPVTVRARLETPGEHSIEITVNNGEGESSSSRPVILFTRDRSCTYIAPGGVTSERPVGDTLQGINPEVGQAARIAQLRRDGWRVEWQWDPPGRRIFMMAECLGTIPQPAGADGQL